MARPWADSPETGKGLGEMIQNGQHNIGHICTRQQCDLGRADKVALRWITSRKEPVIFSFRNLDQESNKWANLLGHLGVERGEVFAILLPKAPEVFFAILGALKAGVIVNTLFSNLGDDALRDRLEDARARVVFTRRAFLKRLSGARASLPSLRVLLLDGDEPGSEGLLSYKRLREEVSDAYEVALTTPTTPSVVHYTSGSTGRPKGVLHVHGGIAYQARTAREILDLRDDDIYWCTADQAWVTGTTYGVIAPWSLGVTQVQFGGGFSAGDWCQVLQEEKVSVWYTAPTALRMLMRESSQFYQAFDFRALRHVCSVGEPLNPEVITWARRVFGRTVHDTWFQTETGGIMIANRPQQEVKPGSMGTPVAGIEAAVIRDDGSEAAVGEHGHLCIKAGWPSMFVSYLNADSVYQSKFKNGYYFSGDKAYRDAEGYFWFLGRSDDVINTAGHLVSPFEVESALLEIDGVVESGVIGAPDDVLFEKVVAFVCLRDAGAASDELKLRLRLHVANRVSTVATPQEIIFVSDIPKNNSGKIMRRLLKARYTGENVGDTSTLEG